MKALLKKLTGRGGASKSVTNEELIAQYLNEGRVAWTKGYWPYKMKLIVELVSTPEKLKSFTDKKLPEGFGFGVDERIVEYGWVFSKWQNQHNAILDAGSTLNFPQLIELPQLKNKNLYIQTLAPEQFSFNERGISYLYADLKEIPIRDNFFDLVFSISTIEHIDMDNEVFGVEKGNNKNVQEKKYGYVQACEEMLRTCKQGGELLITFPYGKWKSYGFFQQLDENMVAQIKERLLPKAELLEETYFKYHQTGWQFASKDELKESLSYNPHTGEDKGNDGAAHCRGVCCLHFKKKI